MSGARDTSLLPGGADVPFAEIEAALARGARGDGRGGSGRALTATIVVVGPRERLAAAADALDALTTGVRTILISDGDHASPAVRVSGRAVAIEGLRPAYLNNAVAALRLSSLPTLVWWRGGAPDTLDGLGELADRLVLDAEDPLPVWARAATLFEKTAVSDLRWTRLTRWRALMAHFFDIPEVRASAPRFRRVQIEGSDPHMARLFAGWLSSSLDSSAGSFEKDSFGKNSFEKKTSGMSIDLLPDAAGGAPIARVRLGEGEQELSLSLASSGTCIETAMRVQGHTEASRIVSLGNQGLAPLIGEELRIRSRDPAFERALARAGGLV